MRWNPYHSKSCPHSCTLFNKPVSKRSIAHETNIYHYLAINTNNFCRKTEFKPIGAQVIINSVLFSMKLPKPVELRKIKAVKIHELFTRVPLNAPIDERIPNVCFLKYI